MPAKKLTARKRAELQKQKMKQQRGSSFPTLLVLFIVIIIGIVAVYFVVSNLGNGEPSVVNNAPSATEDYTVLAKNSATYQIDALANDNDADDDSLTITGISDPSHGEAQLLLGIIYYTPETNFSGVDSFEYTVSDGEKEATADINIVITDTNPVAIFDTTMGTFIVELYEDLVPNTCANFIRLSNDGFYDGMNFYRISDNFMIQAGRYYPDGSSASSIYGNIDFEATAEVLHLDGTISMARGSDLDSASAEFFICDGAQRGLDDDYLLQQPEDRRGYTAFGRTIVGLDVVHTIAGQPHDNSHPAGGGKPYTDIVINSITIEND